MASFDASAAAGEDAILTREELLTPVVLSRLLGFAVERAELTNLAGEGGLSGGILNRVHVYAEGDAVKHTFVLKNEGGWAGNKAAGLAREGLFYKHFAPTLRAHGVSLPVVYYAHGDMSSGQKLILLEDIKDGVQAGYFFGPGSPHNWTKDLEKITGGEGAPSALDITRKAFSIAAKLHAKYWRDESLLQMHFLKGVDWRQGKGEEAYMSTQRQAADAWESLRAKMSADGGGDGGSGVVWDDYLLEVMDSSMSKISWKTYQQDVASATAWTLMHSDCHPANMMWQAAEQRLVLLDWEVVGLGSGPQDLAQFVISHMNPALRKEHEMELLRAYYAELLAERPELQHSYSFDQCLRDYVAGGSERWVWLLALLVTICPPPMVQYFHDQLCAFMKDHNITALSVGMPRI